MSAGAGGTLGAGRVAKAAPDGYTLLLHHIGMATCATLYRKLAYKPLEAFEYIGLVTEVPMAIVGRKDLDPDDLKSLVDYLKANKDKVTYAHAGIGAASHLCGMLFMSEIGTALVTVPYKGTGPAMTDLIGGQVDIMCDQTTNTTKQIKSGEIKAYAMTTQRAPGRASRRANRQGTGPRYRGRRLARPLCAQGNAEGDHRPACRSRCRWRFKDETVVEPLRRDSAPRPSPEDQATPAALEGQARGRDRALAADHRGRRPICRLMQGPQPPSGAASSPRKSEACTGRLNRP